MKLRAPSDCASICHDGQIFVVEADGSIDVPEAMAASLAAHGFTPWDKTAHMPEPSEAEEDGAVDVDALKRGELFRLLRAYGVRASPSDTNAKLRALAREAMEE